MLSRENNRTIFYRMRNFRVDRKWIFEMSFCVFSDDVSLATCRRTRSFDHRRYYLIPWRTCFSIANDVLITSLSAIPTQWDLVFVEFDCGFCHNCVAKPVCQWESTFKDSYVLFLLQTMIIIVFQKERSMRQLLLLTATVVWGTAAVARVKFYSSSLVQNMF